MSILSKSLKCPSWEWLYSEAGHGKGAPDGIGAAIKRQADEFVARGGSVASANDILGMLAGSSNIRIIKEVSVLYSEYSLVTFMK
jgi:hypothetical protein